MSDTPKRGGGRPSTALNQKQLARQKGLELALERGGPSQSMTGRLEIAKTFANFIESGTIPGKSGTTSG